MSKEYRVITINLRSEIKAEDSSSNKRFDRIISNERFDKIITRVLNEYGEKGWEHYYSTPNIYDSDTVTLYFVRRKDY